MAQTTWNCLTFSGISECPIYDKLIIRQLSFRNRFGTHSEAEKKITFATQIGCVIRAARKYINKMAK